MADIHSHSGWMRLENGFDVELIHGIPVLLSDNGLYGPVDDEKLDDEVTKLSGLRSIILGWHEGGNSAEHETTLCIDALQFEEVLKRLAVSSAALFVERYHKPIHADSVDWDKVEYDHDFNRAIEYCCLETKDINKNEFFGMYVECMHQESSRLIKDGASPLVEPE